jgi:hypothetical protein
MGGYFRFLGDLDTIVGGLAVFWKISEKDIISVEITVDLIERRKLKP